MSSDNDKAQRFPYDYNIEIARAKAGVPFFVRRILLSTICADRTIVWIGRETLVALVHTGYAQHSTHSTGINLTLDVGGSRLWGRRT